MGKQPWRVRYASLRHTSGQAFVTVQARTGCSQGTEDHMVGILWVVLVVILVVWLLGLLLDFAGNLIHLLLIVALAVLIYNLLTGRRSV